MPRTAIGGTSLINAPGTNNYTGTVVVMLAADIANQNSFVSTGKEMVIVHNSGAAPHTVTINSVNDANLRTQDITAVSVAADEHRVFGPFKKDGWAQTTNVIHIEANNAEIEFGVVILP